MIEVLKSLGCVGGFLKISTMAFQAPWGNRPVKQWPVRVVAWAIRPLSSGRKISYRQLNQPIIQPAQIALPLSSGAYHNIKSALSYFASITVLDLVKPTVSFFHRHICERIKKKNIFSFFKTSEDAAIIRQSRRQMMLSGKMFFVNIFMAIGTNLWTSEFLEVTIVILLFDLITRIIYTLC